MTTHWTAPESPSQRPVLRVSDAEREQAAALLREHWLAGRLDAGELDDRSSEVWGARTDRELAFALRELPALHRAVGPAPPHGDSKPAVASLVLGIVAIIGFFISLGFLSPVVLPLAAVAWGLGRSARREPHARGHGPATAGLVLGVIGTALSAIFLSGAAVVLL